MKKDGFTPRSEHPRRVEVIQSRVGFLKATAWMRDYDEHITPLYWTIKQNKNSHYLGFSLDDSNRVAYSRGCHRHDYKHRIVTTLGRYIKKNFPEIAEKFTDSFLEYLTSKTFANQPIDNFFTTIGGNAIYEAYANRVGEKSCMTGSSNRDKLDLYVENGVKMVLYDDNMGNSARALLWKTDDGDHCLDRIYPNSGEHVEKFYKYAETRGWLCREGNGFPGGDILIGGCTHEVTISTPSSGEYPYLDSFHYTDDDPSDSGKITLYTAEHDIVFDSQSGGWSPGRMCANCDCSISEEEEYPYGDEGYCENCYSELFFTCEQCGVTVSVDDMQEVNNQDWCSHCTQNNATQCYKCDEYFPDNQGHTVEVDGDIWCEGCAANHASYCQKCEGYTAYGLSEVNTEGGDTKEWCDNCLDSNATYCEVCKEYFEKECNCPPEEEEIEEIEEEEKEEVISV